jgi:hypothetical protein
MGHRTPRRERPAWWLPDTAPLGSPVTALASLGNKRASHPWTESRLLRSGASAAPGWRGGGAGSAASVNRRWYGSVQHRLTPVLLGLDTPVNSKPKLGRQ